MGLREYGCSVVLLEQAVFDAITGEKTRKTEATSTASYYDNGNINIIRHLDKSLDNNSENSVDATNVRHSWNTELDIISIV